MKNKKHKNRKLFRILGFKVHLSKERGIALYLALVILAGITAALLALIVLALSQIRIVWTIGDSVIAFYAADTGMERVLYKIYKENWQATSTNTCIYPSGLPPAGCEGQPCPAAQWESMPGVAAEYQVCVSNISTTTIWSTGNYIPTGTKRKIETKFE